MTVQDWFEKRKEAQIQRRALEARVEIEANPELWTKCVHCDAHLLRKDIEDNDMVCPVCDYHLELMQEPELNNCLMRVLLKNYLVILNLPIL